MARARGDGRIKAGLMAVAGMLGAAGLALLAWSAHGADGAEPSRWLHHAGLIALVHAPVLILLAGGEALPEGAKRLGRWGCGLIVCGVLLFVATLTLRAACDLPAGHPVARLTPVGGTLAIAGWLVIAAAGLRALFAARDSHTRP